MKKATDQGFLDSFKQNSKPKFATKKQRVQEQEFKQHKNIVDNIERFKWQGQAKQNYDIQYNENLPMHDSLDDFDKGYIQNNFENTLNIQDTLNANIQKLKKSQDAIDEKQNLRKSEKRSVVARISVQEQQKILEQKIKQQQEQQQQPLNQQTQTIGSITSSQLQAQKDKLKTPITSPSSNVIGQKTKSSLSIASGTKDYSSISNSQVQKSVPQKTKQQLNLLQKHLSKNLPKLEQKTKIINQQQSYFSVSRNKELEKNEVLEVNNQTNQKKQLAKKIQFEEKPEYLSFNSNDRRNYIYSGDNKNKEIKSPKADSSKLGLNEKKSLDQPEIQRSDPQTFQSFSRELGDSEEECEDNFQSRSRGIKEDDDEDFQVPNQYFGGVSKNNINFQSITLDYLGLERGENQNISNQMDQDEEYREYLDNKKSKSEEITNERSRKRTEKQKKKKSKNEKNDEQQSRKLLDSNKFPEKQFIRSMKDIQTDSQRTSYALTKRSFKWSKSVFSNGQTSLKNGLVSKEQIEHVSRLAKQMVVTDSSDDGFEVEEFVNELEVNAKRDVGKHYALFSEKITEQKGQKYKLKMQQKQQEEKNKQMLMSQSEQIEGQKALQSFYKLLQANNHADIVSSVEVFGEAMTLFIENQKYFSHIITLDSFVYFNSIGEGSFGTVDLYFFKQNKLQDNITSDQNNLKQTWDTSNTSVKNSFPTNQLIFSNQPPNLLQFSNGSFQQDQNNMVFSSEIYQQNRDQQDVINSQQHPYQILKEQSIYMHKIDVEQEESKDKKNQITVQNFLDMQYLPVACKKIENLEEYQRELFIMQTVKCEYMPKLFYQDLDKQLLFMELGLCSLEDLKNDSEENGYTFSDEFTYQILVNLIKAVESLLSNYSEEIQQKQPLFHSDIKPSNVMLTVKKYKNQPNCSIKLLLIDYGGASFSLEDYWAFYTPAFVSESVWKKLIDRTSFKQYLNWEEIRYAEVYAACRSVQFLIVPESEKQLFNKQNYNEFLNQYSYLYPKTCAILRRVYFQENIGSIANIYQNILFESEKTIYTGLNPQNIPFESHKIFELSKFYNCIDIQQNQQPDNNDNNMEEEQIQQNQNQNLFLANNQMTSPVF